MKKRQKSYSLVLFLLALSSVLRGQSSVYCSSLSVALKNMWGTGCLMPLVGFTYWQTLTQTYSHATTATAAPTVDQWDATINGTGMCGILPLENSCPPAFYPYGPSIDGNQHVFHSLVINQINIPLGPVNSCWPSTDSLQDVVSEPVVMCTCEGGSPGSSCGICGVVQEDCSCNDPAQPTCECGSSTCQNNAWSSCPTAAQYQLCCSGTSSASGSAGSWTTPACYVDSQCGTGSFCAYIATCQAQCAPNDDGGDGGDGGAGETCSDDEDCDSGECNCGVCEDDAAAARRPTPQNRCMDVPAAPIVIDLSGAGFLMTDVRNGVRSFDFGGSGKPAPAAWTRRNANVGFLSLLNSDGQIANGVDLFGNLTPQPGGPGGRNGYKALAVFDDSAKGGNGDGQITSADAVWPKLRIWVDANHDGVPQPSELLSLDQAGVAAISLSYTASRWTDAFGNQFRHRGQITWAKPVNGKTDAVIYDVLLQNGEGKL
jgi:hypothetical protein